MKAPEEMKARRGRPTTKSGGGIRRNIYLSNEVDALIDRCVKQTELASRSEVVETAVRELAVKRKVSTQE